jgi:hypothetical protein
MGFFAFSRHQGPHAVGEPPPVKNEIDFSGQLSRRRVEHGF